MARKTLHSCHCLPCHPSYAVYSSYYCYCNALLHTTPYHFIPLNIAAYHLVRCSALAGIGRLIHIALHLSILHCTSPHLTASLGLSMPLSASFFLFDPLVYTVPSPLQQCRPRTPIAPPLHPRGQRCARVGSPWKWLTKPLTWRCSSPSLHCFSLLCSVCS